MPLPVFRDKKNLSQFLSGSLRINCKAELEEFLAQPQARESVRAASYQDIFLVIKSVGLADSLGLLNLTTSEQLRGFIDLDCWRKDSFHVLSFMEWMAASVQLGAEEAARMARAADPNLLALFLKENTEVFALELDEPPPDLPLILTPDRRFGVHITAGREKGMLSRLVLDAIFRFDPSLGYDLIDCARWENRISMEEEAYQEKRRRLEEIGFVDYYEALEIYGEGGVKPSPRSSETGSKADSVAISTTLPALFVASLSSGHFLLDGLQKIADRDDVEHIRQGLAALANRILSVHSVTPGDLEKVQPALEEIRDTLNIALEHLTGRQADRTGEILKQNDVQALFKTGFNLIVELRSQAERLLEHGKLQLTGCKELLLAPSQQLFLTGLRRLQPQVCEGLEDFSKSRYRNFQNLEDIQLARQGLDDIEILARSFWKLLDEGAEKVLASSLRRCVLDREDVRFSHIFNTALVNLLRGRGFIPQLVSIEDIEVLLRELDDDRMEESAFQAVWNQRVKQLVSARLLDSGEQAVLLKYSETWVQRLTAELTPLVGQSPIDRGFIQSLLLKRASVVH